jgi:hypothetical protein
MLLRDLRNLRVPVVVLLRLLRVMAPTGRSVPSIRLAGSRVWERKGRVGSKQSAFIRGCAESGPVVSELAPFGRRTKNHTREDLTQTHKKEVRI